MNGVKRSRRKTNFKGKLLILKEIFINLFTLEPFSKFQ